MYAHTNITHTHIETDRQTHVHRHMYTHGVHVCVYMCMYVCECTCAYVHAGGGQLVELSPKVGDR